MYQQSIYSNKELKGVNVEYLNPFVSFTYNSGEGFLPEKAEEGITPIVISLIASISIIAFSGIVFIIIKKKKKKKCSNVVIIIT